VSELAAGRRRGAIAAVADFLIEPLDPVQVPSGTALTRPVAAVIGLAPRCGTTVVARALGAELALRDPGGASVVSAEVVSEGGMPLGTQAAVRLTRAIGRAVVVRARPVGRVCLTACGDGSALVDAARGLAPLVLDVHDPSQAAVAASMAEAVVLVGLPTSEPALAVVLSDSLSRVGPEPIVVVNRDRGEGDRWGDRCSLLLPESRLGARLALAGREPRGALGVAIAQLAGHLA
jgi:hypothetical protein